MIRKMFSSFRDLGKNGEGYSDRTVYDAIRNAEGTDYHTLPEEKERFYKCLHTIFHLVELAGFTLEGRITLVDRKSGRVWK